tara:strand:- start:10 stop:294 length:285 start_codon:yes stop_codon:yes gene_type:complete
MAVSNWYLYIGMFLCCTGILLPLGIFYIVWWFWHRHEDIEKAKSNFTQNNYFVNTSDSDGGVGGFDNGDTSGKTTVNEGTSRDYMSKETREESR